MMIMKSSIDRKAELANKVEEIRLTPLRERTNNTTPLNRKQQTAENAKQENQPINW